MEQTFLVCVGLWHLDQMMLKYWLKLRVENIFKAHFQTDNEKQRLKETVAKLLQITEHEVMSYDFPFKNTFTIKRIINVT